MVGFNGRTIRAHRAAWMLRHGDISRAGPSYHGMCVLHKCDTPACINVDHLFLGSQIDNINDTTRKGRVPHGKKHHGAKLTPAAVAEIVAKKGKETQVSLARRFGVYPSVISRIYSGEAWARTAQGELP